MTDDTTSDVMTCIEEMQRLRSQERPSDVVGPLPRNDAALRGAAEALDKIDVEAFTRVCWSARTMRSTCSSYVD